MIYALGSTVDLESVPGVAEFGQSLASKASTSRVQNQLLDLADQGGQILIVGGGLTGIEAATEIAETYPQLQVTLMTQGQLGDKLSAKGADHLQKIFGQLGIKLLEDKRVVRLEAGQAHCEDGSVQAFNLCLWAAAFAVPSLAQESGVRSNAQNRIIVDEYLRSLSHPEVYAVGDAACTSLRMACATAMPMGAYAADHLLAQISNWPTPSAFEFAYLLRCISLGRKDALIQMVETDDRPKAQILSGKRAVWIKELICRFSIWAIYFEKYFPGAYRWPKSKLEAKVKQAEYPVT